MLQKLQISLLTVFKTKSKEWQDQIFIRKERISSVEISKK